MFLKRRAKFGSVASISMRQKTIICYYKFIKLYSDKSGLIYIFWINDTIKFWTVKVKVIFILNSFFCIILIKS